MFRKLSPRLFAMAAAVDEGDSVADIGADHGYLPLFLVREGRSPFAILTDVNAGPLEKTRASVGRTPEDTRARVALRLGDGLCPLADGEVDAVVIAGMGGETIISILAEDPAKTRSFRKFILQPRTKTDVLKDWLTGNGFEIKEAFFAEERGRRCEIIVCAPEGETL